MSSFNFKRGGTFTASVTYTPPQSGLQNLLGATITSDVKDAAGTVHSLTTSLDNTGLIVTIGDSYTETATWATGEAKWDIRVQISGTVIYSETVTFTVIPSITLD